MLKRIPSRQLSSNFFGKKTSGKSTNAKPSITQISKDNNLSSITCKGWITDVIPRTVKILNTFEPIRFPIEISDSFLNIAMPEATSSGKLVPIEIREMAITRSLILNALAKPTPPSTRK